MKRSRSDLNKIENKSTSELGLKESSCVKGLFNNNNCPRRYQLVAWCCGGGGGNKQHPERFVFSEASCAQLTILSQNSVMNRIINVVKGPLTSRKAKNGKLVNFVTRRAELKDQSHCHSHSHSHTSSSFWCRRGPPPIFEVSNFLQTPFICKPITNTTK